MLRQCYVILLILLIMGCEKKENQTVPAYNQPWESMAKGYEEENANRVWGYRKYTHISEYDQDGQLYDFVLHTGPLEDLPSEKYQIDKFWGWGGDTKPPKTIYASHVLELSLSLNEKPVSFPQKAYIDLIDLRVGGRYSLLKKNNSYHFLYLLGSDAGESYRVKFTIEDNKLIKREIWYGEFPDWDADVTMYE